MGFINQPKIFSYRSDLVAGLRGAFSLLLAELGAVRASTLFRWLFVICVIALILDGYIKAALGIAPGTVMALYKDALIFVMLILFMCTLTLKYKRIIVNKMDRLFLLFVLFGIFEVLWTYVLAGNLYVGIFRFRLYYSAYFLYFPLVYFFREDGRSLIGSLKAMKIIFYAAFIWAIVEFIMINTGVVSVDSISNFLETSVVGSGVAEYAGFIGGIDLKRGYGIIGHVVNAGVLYVAGFTAFAAYMAKKIYFEPIYIVYFTIGLIAIVLSLSKTAWALLLIVFFSWFLAFRKRRFLLGALMFSAFAAVVALFLGSQTFRNSIGATIVKVLDSYWPQIVNYFQSSWPVKLLGCGYEIQEGDIETFNVGDVGGASMSVGNEIFFMALLKQWGIIGLFVYSLIFLVGPFKVFMKDINPLIKGIALAIIVFGLSSFHYNAIFRGGFNIVNVFFLACLSVLHFDAPDDVLKNIDGLEV